MSVDDDPRKPSREELLEALRAPGPLAEQPAAQALARWNERRTAESRRPRLRLVRDDPDTAGGDEPAA